MIPVMKRLTTAFLLMTFMLAFHAGMCVAADPVFPRPAGAVNDFANVIPAGERTVMENLAREIWQKTGTAVVVATVPTVGDMVVDDYATRLYESWESERKERTRGS